MFIKKDDAIDIKIFYREKNHKYNAYSQEEFNKLELSNDEKLKYKELNLKMKPLSWGMQNDLNESAMVYESDGEKRFSYKAFKETKLQRLITSWDAIDSGGRNIPPSKDALCSLSPIIAETIILAYDSEEDMDEEEEKN